MVDDAFFALTRDIKKRLGESSSSQSAKPKDSVTVRFSLCAVVYIQNCSAHLRDVLVVYPDPVILLKRNTSRPTLLPPPPTSTLALPPLLRPFRSPWLPVSSPGLFLSPARSAPHVAPSILLSSFPCFPLSACSLFVLRHGACLALPRFYRCFARLPASWQLTCPLWFVLDCRSAATLPRTLKRAVALVSCHHLPRRSCAGLRARRLLG